MVQTVGRWPLTAEARFRFQASLCGICGEQIGSGSGFLYECFGFLPSVSYHQCCILVCMPNASRITRTSGLTLGAVKAMLVRMSGSIGQSSTLALLVFSLDAAAVFLCCFVGIGPVGCIR
jgi:hypothetical protein